MATNDDLKDRWSDVIPWTTFWEELNNLLRLTYDQGQEAKNKRIAELTDALQELVDRLDEVQHLEYKLFSAREVLKGE